jgi:hypothetical protein
MLFGWQSYGPVEGSANRDDPPFQADLFVTRKLFELCKVAVLSHPSVERSSFQFPLA